MRNRSREDPPSPAGCIIRRRSSSSPTHRGEGDDVAFVNERLISGTEHIVASTSNAISLNDEAMAIAARDGDPMTLALASNKHAIFRDGEGVAKDLGEAARLWRLAADQGDAAAQ